MKMSIRANLLTVVFPFMTSVTVELQTMCYWNSLLFGDLLPFKHETVRRSDTWKNFSKTLKSHWWQHTKFLTNILSFLWLFPNDLSNNPTRYHWNGMIDQPVLCVIVMFAHWCARGNILRQYLTRLVPHHFPLTFDSTSCEQKHHNSGGCLLSLYMSGQGMSVPLSDEGPLIYPVCMWLWVSKWGYERKKDRRREREGEGGCDSVCWCAAGEWQHSCHIQ